MIYNCCIIRNDSGEIKITHYDSDFIEREEELTAIAGNANWAFLYYKSNENRLDVELRILEFMHAELTKEMTSLLKNVVQIEMLLTDTKYSQFKKGED